MGVALNYNKIPLENFFCHIFHASTYLHIDNDARKSQCTNYFHPDKYDEKHEYIMAKTFSCSHVHSECSWSATENTEGELMKKIAEHAKLHGHDTITPDLEKKVKSLIKEA